MNTCLDNVLSQLQPDEKIVLITTEGCHACKSLEEEVAQYPVEVVPVETPAGNSIANKADLHLFPSLLVVKGAEMVPIAKLSTRTCLLTKLGLD